MNEKATNKRDEPSPPPWTPYPHLFRLLHWVLAGAVPWMIVTGFVLHVASRPGWSLTGGRVPAWVPGLRWPLLHLLGALAFAPAMGAAATTYLLRRRQSTAPPRRRQVDDLLVAGGILAVLTGTLLVHPAGPAWVYAAVRALHALAALALLAAFAFHAALALGPYRKMLALAFHPWREPRWARLAVLPFAALAAAWLIAGPILPGSRDLVARRAASPGDVIDRLPWDEARPLRVALSNGAGFRAGRTDVELRAFHDGRELFIRAVWDDPREDRRMTPWIRTSDGWKQLATEPEDERIYYEDKFSFIFPTAPGAAFRFAGCAAHCHLGGGRSYGFKGAGRLVDEWHWKATRTDPFGTADDNYWLGFDRTRQRVGRRHDSDEAGGYESNSKSGVPHPLWLPAGGAAVYKGGLRKDRAVPYTAARAESIPAGAEIPGIVIGPWEGDRADVRCVSRHEDGRWRLDLRRALNTGSPHDIRFEPGGRYPFGCAAFDHCSRRHAYALGACTLVLDP
jgi:hypothetical protein